MRDGRGDVGVVARRSGQVHLQVVGHGLDAMDAPGCPLHGQLLRLGRCVAGQGNRPVRHCYPDGFGVRYLRIPAQLADDIVPDLIVRLSVPSQRLLGCLPAAIKSEPAAQFAGRGPFPGPRPLRAQVAAFEPFRRDQFPGSNAGRGDARAGVAQPCLRDDRVPGGLRGGPAVPRWPRRTAWPGGRRPVRRLRLRSGSAWPGCGRRATRCQVSCCAVPGRRVSAGARGAGSSRGLRRRLAAHPVQLARRRWGAGWRCLPGRRGAGRRRGCAARPGKRRGPRGPGCPAGG